MAIADGTNAGFVSTAPTVDPAGNHPDSHDEGYCNVTGPFTAPAGINQVTSLGFYVDNAATGGNTLCLGLYSHNAETNLPDALVASVAGLTISAGAGWKTGTLATPYKVTAGAKYWVANALGTGNEVDGDGTDNASYKFRWDSTGDGASFAQVTPWPSDFGRASIQAMYAVYQAVPPTTQTTIAKARIKLAGITKAVITKVRIKLAGITKSTITKMRVKLVGLTYSVLAETRIKLSGITKTVLTQARINIDANTVALWRMNEETGDTVNDESSNNNDLTFAAGAAAPTWVTGKYGTGLAFDGDAYATFTTTNIPTGTNEATVELWVKLTAEPAGTMSIFAYGGDPGSKTNQSLGILLNVDSLSVWCGGGSPPSATIDWSANLNTWCYIVVTLDGTNSRLYFNGELVGTPGTVPNITMDLSTIGCIGAYGYYLSSGVLDDIRISNIAKTDDEILANSKLGIIKTTIAKARIKLAGITKSALSQARVKLVVISSAISETRIRLIGVVNSALMQTRIKLTNLTYSALATTRIKIVGLAYSVTSQARIKLTSVYSVLATMRVKLVGITKSALFQIRIKLASLTYSALSQTRIKLAGIVNSTLTTMRIKLSGLTYSALATARIKLTGLAYSALATTRIKLAGLTYSALTQARIKLIVVSSAISETRIKLVSLTYSALSQTRIKLASLTYSALSQARVKLAGITKSTLSQVRVRILGLTYSVMSKTRVMLAGVTRTALSLAHIAPRLVSALSMAHIAARGQTALSQARVKLVGLLYSSLSQVRIKLIGLIGSSLSTARIRLTPIYSSLATAKIKIVGLMRTATMRLRVKLLGLTETALMRAHIQNPMLADFDLLDSNHPARMLADADSFIESPKRFKSEPKTFIARPKRFKTSSR